MNSYNVKKRTLEKISRLI